MSGHLYEAQDLKDAYPECTAGFTIFEIERIWGEYSERNYAAVWLEPDESTVCAAFNHFRK